MDHLHPALCKRWHYLKNNKFSFTSLPVHQLSKSPSSAVPSLSDYPKSCVLSSGKPSRPFSPSFPLCHYFPYKVS